MPLYRIDGNITTQLPPQYDPRKVEVQVKKLPDGSHQIVDAGAIYNTTGRLYISIAALEAEQKARRDAAEKKAADEKKRHEAAKADCEAANDQHNRNLQDKVDADHARRVNFSKQDLAERGINATSNTVDNISLLKGAVHDSVEGVSKFLGYVLKGPGGYVANGVNVANTSAKEITRSGLLDIVPGSTPTGYGANDAINQVSGVGSMANALNPSRFLGNTSQVAGIATDLNTAYNNFEATGNILRSAVPQLGNITSLSSDQLRALAADVRGKWSPGMLEKLNGLSREQLASDIEALADAKDAQVAKNKASREAQATLDASRQNLYGMCIQRK